MKTFILALMLTLTAVSGVVAAAQPAAANTPTRTPERVDPPKRAQVLYCGTNVGSGHKQAAATYNPSKIIRPGPPGGGITLPGRR